MSEELKRIERGEPKSLPVAWRWKWKWVPNCPWLLTDKEPAASVNRIIEPLFAALPTHPQE